MKIVLNKVINNLVIKKKQIKKTKQNKKKVTQKYIPILIIDEVKIFEEQLEKDYEEMKEKDKITIKWSKKWLNKLRIRL